MGSCSTDKLVRDADAARLFLSCAYCECVFANVRAGRLTDDGAALAVSRQLVVEDAEEQGEAEHQRDLERVAFAASKWQGEADHIGQDDENGGQQ